MILTWFHKLHLWKTKKTLVVANVFDSICFHVFIQVFFDFVIVLFIEDILVSQIKVKKGKNSKKID